MMTTEERRWPTRSAGCDRNGHRFSCCRCGAIRFRAWRRHIGHRSELQLPDRVRTAAVQTEVEVPVATVSSMDERLASRLDSRRIQLPGDRTFSSAGPRTGTSRGPTIKRVTPTRDRSELARLARSDANHFATPRGRCSARSGRYRSGSGALLWPLATRERRVYRQAYGTIVKRPPSTGRRTAKMPSVEGGNRGRAMPGRQNDIRCIGHADRLVRIAVNHATGFGEVIGA
jgi:hypothetical protein